MINLNDKWRVNADTYGYVLEELITSKKTGEAKWTPKFYYSTVKGTIKGCRTHSIRNIEIENDLTFKQLLDRIEGLDKDFIDKLGMLNIPFD